MGTFVVSKHPGERARVRPVRGPVDLAILRAFLGGYAESLGWDAHVSEAFVGVTLWIDKNAAIKGLEPNLELSIGTVVGPVVATALRDGLDEGKAKRVAEALDRHDVTARRSRPPLRLVRRNG